MDQVTRVGRCTLNFPSKPHASRSMKRRMRTRVCCSGMEYRSLIIRRSESMMPEKEQECRVEPRFESNHACVCRHNRHYHDLVNNIHECRLCNAKWYDDGNEVW